MRSIVALACFFVAVVLLGGCGPRSSGGQPSTPSDQGEAAEADRVPGTARLVCDRAGTRLLTPRVKARPDGVRFVIDNRFGTETGYSFEYPEGGGGGAGVPKGESERVGDFPPGEVRLGCEEPPVDGVGTDYKTLKVTDPEGFYKAVELECPGGRGVTGSGGGRTGEGPVKLARRVLSDRLRNDDAVEIAGYPRSPEKRIVRVVRDGRIAATVEFIRGSGGWRESSVSSCSGF